MPWGTSPGEGGHEGSAHAKSPGKDPGTTMTFYSSDASDASRAGPSRFPAKRSALMAEAARMADAEWKIPHLMRDTRRASA